MLSPMHTFQSYNISIYSSWWTLLTSEYLVWSQDQVLCCLEFAWHEYFVGILVHNDSKLHLSWETSFIHELVCSWWYEAKSYRHCLYYCYHLSKSSFGLCLFSLIFIPLYFLKDTSGAYTQHNHNQTALLTSSLYTLALILMFSLWWPQLLLVCHLGSWQAEICLMWATNVLWQHWHQYMWWASRLKKCSITWWVLFLLSLQFSVCSIIFKSWLQTEQFILFLSHLGWVWWTE